MYGMEDHSKSYNIFTYNNGSITRLYSINASYWFMLLSKRYQQQVDVQFYLLFYARLRTMTALALRHILPT